MGAYDLLGGGLLFCFFQNSSVSTILDSVYDFVQNFSCNILSILKDVIDIIFAGIAFYEGSVVSIFPEFSG